jgi:hypothetical protein
MADKKDTRSSRSKLLDEMPDNIMTKMARKASRIADKLGFTQEDKYGGKTKEEVMKKAKGGMVTARGQGKVMKTKSCKMY